MKHVHTAALCGAMALAQGCSWQQLSDAQEAKFQKSFELNEKYVDQCALRIIDASVPLPGPDGVYISGKEMKNQFKEIVQQRREYLEKDKIVVMSSKEMNKRGHEGASAFHSGNRDLIVVRESILRNPGRDYDDIAGGLTVGPDLGVISLTAEVVNHELGHAQSDYDTETYEKGHAHKVDKEAGSNMQRVYNTRDYPYTVSNIGSLVMDYMYDMHTNSIYTLDYYLGQEELTPELLDTAESQLYSMGLSENEYLDTLIQRSELERERLDVLGISNEEMAHIVYDCLYDYQIEIDTEVYEGLVEIAEEENNEARQEAQRERKYQHRIR